MNRSHGAVAPIAVATIALAALALPACQPPDDATRLTRLLAEHRPFVARLSFAPAHRPCTEPGPLLCEAPPDRLGDDGRVDAFVGLATSADPHVAAVALLVAGAAAGQPNQVERAVERLEAACAEPHTAACRNDLAVARWVQGMTGGDLHAKARALGDANRAFELEAGSTAVRYNRALLLQSAYLDYQALDAWREVEAAEEDAGFRAEAAERRALLERPTLREQWEEAKERLHGMSGAELAEVVTLHRQQVRIHLQDVVLPAWGRAVDAGEEESAAAELALAAALVGELTPPPEGSLHVADSVRGIAEGLLDARQLRKLATAYRLYGEAIGLHEEQRYEPAEPLFRQSAAAFAEAGDPFEFWPRLYLAIIDHHRPDYQAALAALGALRRQAIGEDRVAAAYVDWMEGLTYSRKAYRQEAFERFEAAAKSFEGAGEMENLSAMESQMASVLVGIGDTLAAWPHHDRTLALRPHHYKTRRLQNALDAVGSQLATTDDRLALPFFDEWLHEAERSGEALGQTYAQADRAESLARLDRYDEAEAALQRAAAAAEQIPTEDLRRDVVSTDVPLAEANVYEHHDPERALTALGRVRDFSRKTGASLRLVEALRRMVKIHHHVGNLKAGELALTEAVAEIERQRFLLDRADQRIAYLDSVFALLQEGVAFYVDADRGDDAFLLAERMRAFVLREQLYKRGLGGRLRSKSELLAALPSSVMVLAYTYLSERLILWTINSASIKTVTLYFSDSELARSISNFSSIVQSGADFSHSARLLAQRVLPSTLPDTVNQLIVVADGVLFDLSFDILPSPRNPEIYLYEDFSIELAYSVNTHLDLQARWYKPRRQPPPSILLVSDVEHDLERFPQLPRLNLRLLDSWIGRIPGTTMLQGSNATKRLFLRELSEHDVVIFFGHHLTETSPSAMNGLVLAKERHDDSLLTAADLESTQGLVPPQTVILVGCATGQGDLSTSEGLLSLGRAFLAIGTPTVVVTRWPIEERVAKGLLGVPEGFHWSSHPLESMFDFLASRPTARASFVLLGVHPLKNLDSDERNRL